MTVKILFIILAFTIYSLMHSFLLPNVQKAGLQTISHNLKPFYRLTSTIVQTTLFFVMIKYVPRSSQVLWEVKGILYWFFRIVQLAGLIDFIWAARSFNLKEFLGLAQIIQYFKNKSDKVELETPEFYTHVAFAYIRHPLYFFTILIFLFEPRITVFNLLLLIWLIIYFWIGSILEEKRMVKQFGDSYRQYQRQVNRFFPKIKKYHSLD